MADIIARFKGDTSDLDQKIKKGSQTLLQMKADCEKVGGAFINLEKNEVEFIRSLGQMETGAKSAKGTISELQRAFTDMSAVYNRLSDEEKADEGGKALRASLDELKERIKDGKKELENINGELSNTKEKGSIVSDVLEGLAGKFGLNVSQLGKLGGALGAATAATKVASDAFFANEQNLDEWGRITSSCESVYRGFLDALNTGDISGYLSKISSIISAARDAYDALDELATYNAFNQIQVEKARAGLTGAQADYREGKGSKEDVKKASDEYINQLTERQKKEQDAYKAAVKELASNRGVNENDLYNALSGSYGSYEQLKKTKMTGEKYVAVGGGIAGPQIVKQSYAANDRERMGQALRQINDTELQSLQSLGAQAQRTQLEIEQSRKQTARILSGSGSGGGGSHSGGSRGSGHSGGSRGGSSTTKVEVQKTEEQLNTEAINQLTQEYVSATDDRKTAIREEIALLQKRNDEISFLKKEAQGKLPTENFVISEKDLLKQDLAEAQKMMEESRGTSMFQRYYEEVQKLSQELDELNGKKIEVVETSDLGILQQLTNEIKDVQAAMQGASNPEDWASMNDYLQSLMKKMKDFTGETAIEENANKVKKMEDVYASAVSSVGSLGSAMQSLGDIADNEGLKVGGLIANAIATIAQTFAGSLKGTFTPWDWIAGAAAGTATMISTIAAIKSATAEYHAQGGIVGQSGPFIPRGTDTIPAMLTPGEVVLSRAQTANLATQLQGGGIGAMHLETTIYGEDLRIMLRNNGRRTGRGEYITSRSR